MSDAGALNVEHERSVDEDLRSAFASLKQPAETLASVEAPADIEPTEEQKAADQRARDEQGRFAKKEDKPAEAAPAAEAQPVTPEPAKPAIKAPDGWTAQAKAKFATLEPDVQQEILRRETELTRKITSQDDDRTLGKRVREAALPYTATLVAEGASVDAAFGQYLNTAYILRTGTPQAKAQALGAIAQQFGVPLNLLQQPQQFQVDPAIETLQQRVDRMERERQAEINTRQQQDQQAVQSEIEAFAAAPGHDHFETVKPLMGTLLSGGHAKDLQDAYDQACHAHPEIRSTLAQEDAGKRVAAEAAKAEAAKRAAVSVVGGPGGAKAPANANGSSDLSIEDQLRASFRAANGRV